MSSLFYVVTWSTLSEESAHPTVYNHLSQLSVDIQLSGLIKFEEVSGVKMQLAQVIFRSHIPII